MNSSDIIRRNKAQTIYIDQLNTFIASNKNGDCGKLSTCNILISSCSHYFPSYTYKYDFFTGRNACVSTTVCSCPINGGNQ